MATPTAEVKRVRFSLDDDRGGSRNEGETDGHWDFLKYLLTLREEFNVNSVVDTLIQKGIISADAGTDVMRQGSARAQIELCVQEVMKGGPPGFVALCETLQEHGYSNIVDALRAEGHINGFLPELNESQSSLAREKLTPQHWSQSSSVVQEPFTIQGKKMALSALSREAKASQKEFSVIVERQQELEKQLVQVMKSLDTAKDMLIRERQEKIALKDQLKGRDEELVAVQRKFLDLQKAMTTLRETNNKYHEKVTRLQIENEQLRRGAKDRHVVESELKERNNECERLKGELRKQETQMKNQEEQIVKKLSMIEKVVGEHRGLMEGQAKLNKTMTQQAADIIRLTEEKAETEAHMATQQRQLNFQNAQIVMLQEQMQRLEAQMIGQGGGASGYNGSNDGMASRAESLPPLPSTPSADGRGSRYISSLSKGMNLRPFNAQGKLENSKNSYWRNDPLPPKRSK